MLQKIPPAFNAGQNIPRLDLMGILASKAPKSQKELMMDHGFDPQAATTEEFIEICEGAETLKNSKKTQFKLDDDSSDDERHKQKQSKKKLKATTTRAPFFCKLHGPNPSHNTSQYKVLNSWLNSWQNLPRWSRMIRASS
jgi:hypothetical protein